MKQNVKKKETYIPSSNGRDKLHVIVWIPQGEIKAVLQISHGMIEDMERYDHLQDLWLPEEFWYVEMIIWGMD